MLCLFFCGSRNLFYFLGLAEGVPFYCRIIIVDRKLPSRQISAPNSFNLSVEHLRPSPAAEVIVVNVITEKFQESGRFCRAKAVYR